MEEAKMIIEIPVIIKVGGFLVTTLLCIVSWFLRDLHRDFKEMSTAVTDLIKDLAVAREQAISKHNLIDNEMKEVKRRLNVVESKLK